MCDCSVLASVGIGGGARNSRDESLHPRPPPPMGGACAPRGIHISLSPTLQSLRLKAGGESQSAKQHSCLFVTATTLCVSTLFIWVPNITSTSRGKGAESDLGSDHNFPTFWRASSTFGGQNETKSSTNKSISRPIFQQCYPTSESGIENYFSQARIAR